MSKSVVHQSGRGFTLMEMLVATAVLCMLVVLFTQIAGSVGRSYLIGKGQSETNMMGRAVVDTVAGDIERVVQRPDLAVFTQQNAAGESTLRFYCQRSGMDDGSATNGTNALRGVSVVEYALNLSGNDQGSLIRVERPAHWADSAALIPLGMTNTDNVTDVEAATPSNSVTCEGVVGVGWSFLSADGQSFSTYPTNTIVAVRVSLAISDPQSFQLLKSAGKVDAMMNLFTASSAGDSSGVAFWRKTLDAQAAQFPSRCVQGVRFYERMISLPYTPIEN